MMLRATDSLADVVHFHAGTLARRFLVHDREALALDRFAVGNDSVELAVRACARPIR